MKNSFLSSTVQFSRNSMSESVVLTPQTPHTRPYTVGVSIAVVLIFIIAIFHAWNYLFKKIKKRLSKSDFELDEVEVEVPVGQLGGRRVSSAFIQELEVIGYDVSFENELFNTKESRGAKVFDKSQSLKNFERSPSRQIRKLSLQHQKYRQSGDKIIFFAGYCHQHNNDA